MFNTLDEDLNTKEYFKVKEDFDYFAEILNIKLSFWLDSKCHTYKHSLRVLLFSLILAKKLKLNKDGVKILGLSAIYHDTRRHDDLFDKGHGMRAAYYYKMSYKDYDLPYFEAVPLILSYHDQNDELAYKVIKDPNTSLLFKIFKDADALDRLRFGPSWLDTSYLRLKESFELIPLATKLNSKIVDLEEKEVVNTSNGHYLIVVDMQNDFVTGSLGTKEAESILKYVEIKAKSFNGEVIFTKDSHDDSYLDTIEGKNLPVKHCIRGTLGHDLVGDLELLVNQRQAKIIEKETFGSLDLVNYLLKKEVKSLELVGLCTDICVISNAILLKTYFPNTPVFVDTNGVAGVSPKLNKEALDVLESLQVVVLNNFN